jgi:hypothetical protein
MTERRRVGPAQLVRAGLTVLVALLVVLAANIATPTTASAHEGHSCSGRTSSGFSCARGTITTSDYTIKRVFTYYNGSQRTFGELWFERATNRLTWLYTCDDRANDNITLRLEVNRASVIFPGIDYYTRDTDTGNCSWHRSLFERAWSYRLTTLSSGVFSHATVWCHECVPGHH